MQDDHNVHAQFPEVDVFIPPSPRLPQRQQQRGSKTETFQLSHAFPLLMYHTLVY